MSKLSEFYSIKSQIFEGDVESEAKWDAIEEKLIREELLPEITELIKPLISQVKSPLSIQVNYDPKGNLAVSATRNCIQALLPMEQLAHVSTSTPVVTIAEPIIEGTMDSKQEDITHNTHAKSVGIRVLFRDGTIIQEDKAVDTFIKALQHIGLQRLAKGNHGVTHAGFRLVGTEKRPSATKKQALVDGYYIYTHMSNEDKMDDLMQISRYYNLGIEVEWVESKIQNVSAEVHTSHKSEVGDKGNAESRFQQYMEQNIALRTVRSYISAMPIISDYIIRYVDNSIKSIYDITDVHMVELCNEMLGQSEEYLAENDKRHHQLSAALNKYIKFLSE